MSSNRHVAKHKSKSPIHPDKRTNGNHSKPLQSQRHIEHYSYYTRAGASQEHNRHPLYFLISIAPPLKPPTKLALGSNINGIGSLKVLCMVLEPRAKLHIKLKYHTLADIPNPKFHPVISYDNNET